MDKPVWTIMKILNWTKQHFEAKGRGKSTP